MKREIKTKNNNQVQTEHHRINILNKHQMISSSEANIFIDIQKKQPNHSNNYNFNSSLLNENTNNNFQKQHMKNINNELLLDNPVKPAANEKRDAKKDLFLNNYLNQIELQHKGKPNITNIIIKPQNKTNFQHDNKLLVKFKDSDNQIEYYDINNKGNIQRDNQIKLNNKVNKKEFSEDSCKAEDYNFQQLQEMEYKKKQGELFNKAIISDKNKLESNFTEKYIFDPSQDEKKKQLICDSTSDIDRMLSETDKKDDKFNLFGKPFANQPIAEIKKPQAAAAFNKKDNVKHLRLIENTNLDLFQIFGDCTNKPHN